MWLPMSVVVLVGLVASFFSLCAPVPQILRAARSRSAEGVSWNSMVMSLMTFTVWAVYSCAVADGIQIVNNLLGLGLLIALAVAVLRAGVTGTYWTAVAAVLGTVAVSSVVVDLTSPFTLAILGTLASSSRLFPQARVALSGAPLWGLCPWSTVLTWLGMAGWAVYGVAVGDPGVAVCSVVAVALQSAILRHRLPPRRTLHSVARGRLGDSMAQLAAPASARFPYRGSYKLAA